MIDPWSALMKMLIQSSKVSSKHSRTASSCTPSSIEKVFTSCSTRYSSFSRIAYDSSACANTWNRFYSNSGASL